VKILTQLLTNGCYAIKINKLFELFIYTPHEKMEAVVCYYGLSIHISVVLMGREDGPLLGPCEMHCLQGWFNFIVAKFVIIIHGEKENTQECSDEFR